MSDIDRTNSREMHLNDSWVELHFRSQRSSVSQSPATTPPLLSSVAMMQPHYTAGQMEKLLLEAQRESNGSSIADSHRSTNSSRSSPKDPHSPNNERNENIPAQTQEWIWDWSSRPEVVPPSDMGNKYKHPKRAPLSVRNTAVMRNGLFCLENLPTLIFTHACTFVIGATVVFLYLKKCCRWSPSVLSIDS